MEQATEFALDVQELSKKCETQDEFIAAMKAAIDLNKNNIDMANSSAQTIAFMDGSTATLQGHNFVIGNLKS